MRKRQLKRAAKRAQDAELKLHEERDRVTKGPSGAKSEPQFRTGVDRSKLGREGFAEVKPVEEPR